MTDSPAPSAVYSMPVRIARALMLLAVAELVAALIIMWRVDVRTVLITGSLLLLTGIALIFVARNARYGAAYGVGLSHAVFVGFIVAIVNIFRLSPDDALKPFSWLGGAYILLMVFAGRVAWKAAPRTPDPSRCTICGYLLFGLHEPRCPECGTPFDPRLLETVA